MILQLLADWPLGRHVLVVSLGLSLLHILLLPLVHGSLQYIILNARVVIGTSGYVTVPGEGFYLGAFYLLKVPARALSTMNLLSQYA